MSEVTDRLEKIVAAKGSSSAIKIICKGCGDRLPWNEAAAKRWKYDPKGKAFNAFYCFPCQGKL